MKHFSVNESDPSGLRFSFLPFSLPAFILYFSVIVKRFRCSPAAVISVGAVPGGNIIRYREVGGFSPVIRPPPRSRATNRRWSGMAQGSRTEPDQAGQTGFSNRIIIVRKVPVGGNGFGLVWYGRKVFPIRFGSSSLPVGV